MGANDDREQDLETRTRAAVAAATEGISDATLIRALGVSRQSVRNYKNAAVTIPLDTAVALAAHLGLTVDQLAGAAPPPDRSPLLLAVAEDLTRWADSQAALADLMRDAALTVESHAAPALGDSGTG